MKRLLFCIALLCSVDNVFSMSFFPLGSYHQGTQKKEGETTTSYPDYEYGSEYYDDIVSSEPYSSKQDKVSEQDKIQELARELKKRIQEQPKLQKKAFEVYQELSNKKVEIARLNSQRVNIEALQDSKDKNKKLDNIKQSIDDANNQLSELKLKSDDAQVIMETNKVKIEELKNKIVGNKSFFSKIKGSLNELVNEAITSISEQLAFKLSLATIDTATQARIAAIEATQGLKEVTKKAGEELKDVATQTSKELTKNILYGAAAAVGAYGVIKLINWYLTKPKLLSENAKQGILNQGKEWILDKLGMTPPSRKLVFASPLEKQLDRVAIAAQTINQNIKAGKKGISYRNLMLYGPPGTGKTAFAEKLARESGLTANIMSGATFFRYSPAQGVEMIEELFNWANKGTGNIIIVDEAESFLARRETMAEGSPAYQLLNSFLSFTGSPSNKFMLVFMTNFKDRIDSAVLDRVTDFIELPLPDKKERIEVLKLYRGQILLNPEYNEPSFIESVNMYLNDAEIEKIAEKTDKMSNRELQGVINTIKTDAIAESAAQGNASVELSKSIIDGAVGRALSKLHAKQKQKE